MRANLARYCFLLITFLAFNFTAHAQNQPHIFCSDRDGDYDIYLADANGVVTNLTNNANDDLTPTLSPDGKRVAYASDEGGSEGVYQIFVIDFATRTKRRLTSGDIVAAIYPSWSPDSSRIAYTRVDGFAYFFGLNNIADIYVVTAPTDGGAIQNFAVTNTAPDQIAPAWSPDGTRIAYMQGSLRTPETTPIKIFTQAVNPTGTRTSQAAIQQTFGTSLDITPAWSPDSSQLVFSSNAQDANFELYLLTPQTTANTGASTPSRLTFFPLDDVLPAWSRDGRSIVFTNGDASSYINPLTAPDNPPPGDNYIISRTGGTPVALITNTASDDNDAELLPSSGKTRRTVRRMRRSVNR